MLVGKIQVGLEHRLNKNAKNARTSFAFTVATHDETHEFIIYISSEMKVDCLPQFALLKVRFSFSRTTGTLHCYETVMFEKINNEYFLLIFAVLLEVNIITFYKFFIITSG